VQSSSIVVGERKLRVPISISTRVVGCAKADVNGEDVLSTPGTWQVTRTPPVGLIKTVLAIIDYDPMGNGTVVSDGELSVMLTLQL